MWQYPPPQDVSTIHSIGNHDSMVVSDSTSSMSPVAIRGANGSELVGDLSGFLDQQVSDPQAPFQNFEAPQNGHGLPPLDMPTGPRNGVSSDFLPISSPNSFSSMPSIVSNHWRQPQSDSIYGIPLNAADYGQLPLSFPPPPAQHHSAGGIPMDGGAFQIPQQSLGMAAVPQQIPFVNQSEVARATSPSIQFSMSASIDDSFGMDNCSVRPPIFSRDPSVDMRLQSMASGYGAVRGVSPGCQQSRYNPMDGDLFSII